MKQIHVVVLAIRLSVLLIEVPLLQRNATGSAFEAVSVPHLIQSVYRFL